MIKHIVMWKMAKSPDWREKALDIKKSLEGLRGKIPYVKDIRVGINFNESDSASDVVLESVFESKEDLEAYQIHPDHKAAGTLYVKPYVIERRVVDYEF